MLTLYIACLILGGALVAVSIVADGAVDNAVDGEGVVAAARFISLRNGVFFTAFFGLTGSLLSLVEIDSRLSSVFAVGFGLLAAVSLHRMMEFLQQSETGELSGPGTLEGSLAEVVVDIDDEHTGKVSVRGGDRTLQLVARVHDAAETRRFHTGDEVVIVDLDNGIARIAGTAFLA